MRLQGVTSLGPLGVLAVFAALVCGVAGVSIFALGASFNYLVSLFYEQPIRQGLFKSPVLQSPIERWYLPAAAVTLVAGLATAAVSLMLSLQGWPIERLAVFFGECHARAHVHSAGFMVAGDGVLSELNQRQRGRERVRV